MFRSLRILSPSSVPRVHWRGDQTGPHQLRGEGAQDSQHFLSERTAPCVTRYSLRMLGRSLSPRNLAQLAPALPALRSWPNPAGTGALPLVPSPLQSEGRGTQTRPSWAAPGPEDAISSSPSPRAGPSRPPRGSAGPRRPDAERRSAGAQPGPPRLQAATPGPEEPTGRQPGGGGGEARGRRPSHTLTWLLVVVAYYDEVVGQPGHGRRRRAGEAGARCRLRRRRPPAPGGLSIFPAAAVAAAAALQPCLTTEARSAPAPCLASAPPPPPPALAG